MFLIECISLNPLATTIFKEVNSKSFEFEDFSKQKKI